MADSLIELKNLGKTSVHWLNAIGIKTATQLREAGSVNAYIKIRDRGFKVSKVLLYSIEGALTDKYWNELNQKEKQRLVENIRLKTNNTNKH